MTKLVAAKETVSHLIDLLKAAGGLQIDVQIEEVTRDGDLPDCFPREFLSIDISGKDAGLFVRNNFELLESLHRIAAASLGLDGTEHDLLWFDVLHLRAERMRQLQELADLAVMQVRSTHMPHTFAPMLSCERHMLNQALRSSGLTFASQGEGADRCVILYPEAREAEQSCGSQVPEATVQSDHQYDAA